MRWLKLLLLLVLCLIILFAGIMFTVYNTQKVSIDLVLVQLPQASLSLWLIAFFVAGGVLGTILSTIVIVSLKAKLSLSRRKVDAINKELAAYRAKIV
ncbi:LapA family protein [Gammaproteobacteria bacterium AS21]